MDVRAWRFQRIAETGLDAVLCFLPHHVLMLSGYRPRLGSGVVLATRDGEVRLAVPIDELEAATAVSFAEIVGYESGTLDKLISPEEALAAALRRLTPGLAAGARVGFEDRPAMTPNAYVSTLQIGAATAGLLAAGLDGARLEPASDLLRELRSRLSEAETVRLREACALGQIAFNAAREAIRPGRPEYEVAAAAQAALAGFDDARWSPGQPSSISADRGGGAWVMSGPNSALAYRAFAATGARRLQPGDLVLVHMNPQVGGLWSDLTRTFMLGEAGPERRSMLDAVLDARTAALATIQAGLPAREVDAAARASLARRGFGAAFKHQTGHGVGLNGISGADAPVLHPLSQDVLASAMCFNVEPAVYLDGIGGCRHCDVVRVGDSGLEELSPYLASADELTVAC